MRIKGDHNMSREAVNELFDRWVNDPEFRQQVRTDAEGAVRRTGAQLDEDEWASLRTVDWNLPDAELQARVSKYGG
jgi:hypothetical protein